ncbi:uncharacterized protein [Diadema antillarum]|uniref:uncharacterized protein n=1 Tax=Diadema antillarum TaxID=105358 RepID=UPI003A85A62A
MDPLLGSSHHMGEEKTPSLATGMAEGELKDIESIRNYLSSHTIQRVINAAASDGRTALMIACGKGQEDMVRFLLENGANPNIVICRREKHAQPTIAHKTRIKIVQTLLQHGATFRKNEAELTPLQLAALSLLASLVEFLIFYKGCDDRIAESDKITALEMLGFSQSMDGQESSSYETLCKVISRRWGNLPERRADPELEAVLHCTEKHLLADVKAIWVGKHGMRFQWFLIGDRVIPEGAKGKYFYRPLANFAYMCTRLGEAAKGCSIFKYLLQCESHSKATLGTVMGQMTSFFGVSFYDVDFSVVSQACEVVNEYRDVIRHVTKSYLIEHGPQLLQRFGELLFDFAFYFSEPELLESMIKTAQIVITKVRSACNFISADLDKCTAASLTYHFMEKLLEALFENVYCRMTRSSVKRVKRVMCKLLWYDDVTYVDHKNNTLLHLLAYSASAARDMTFIVDLARVMIRHGCPVHKANDEDGTALNILMEDDGFRLDDDVCKQLVDVLNPLSSIMTLEEMASRTILQSRIPYHGMLPEKICEKIEGETMVPDIRALTDSLQIGSESD